MSAQPKKARSGFVKVTVEHQKMRFLCRIGIHAWSVWSKPVEYKSGFMDFTEKLQIQICLECGEHHERRV